MDWRLFCTDWQGNIPQIEQSVAQVARSTIFQIMVISPDRQNGSEKFLVKIYSNVMVPPLCNHPFQERILLILRCLDLFSLQFLAT